jgi:two-component system, chemotaxis family, chemotaxis protein CheY
VRLEWFKTMLRTSARILIVDDMDSLCELERALLNELGYYDVTAARDVASAKIMLQDAASKGFKFDVVLSDINMPGENGLEFLKWIRSQDSFVKTPVIMVSAVADLDNVMKAAERGATSFIVKPLVKDKLRQKLEKL